MISGENLVFGHDKALNNPISFSLKEGDFVCLMGDNGVGKSTFIETLAGMIAPLRGAVKLNNHLLGNIGAHEKAKKIALVLTERPSIDFLRVSDILKMGRSPYLDFFSRLMDEDLHIIEQKSKFVGIEHLKNKFFNELSDGQKQRVMIARALIQDTPILILDEPTSFLDFKATADILILLKKISVEFKKTVLFSCHDWNFVSKICPHIWLLNDKNLITSSPEDLGMSGLFPNLSPALDFDMSSFNYWPREGQSSFIEVNFFTENEKANLWFQHFCRRNNIKRDPAGKRLSYVDDCWYLENESFKDLRSLEKALLK